MSQILPRINGTAELSVRSDKQPGNSRALKAYITGWPDQSVFPDGEVDFQNITDLLNRTESRFGQKLAIQKIVGGDMTMTRCFDWTQSPGSHRVIYGTSYKQGQQPTEMSLFFPDAFNHTWRASFSSGRVAARMLSSHNRVFNVTKEQPRKVLLLCSSDWQVSGETALLVHSVKTMTHQEVQGATAIHYPSAPVLSPHKLQLHGTWNDWVEGPGRNIPVVEMPEYLERPIEPTSESLQGVFELAGPDGTVDGDDSGSVYGWVFD